MPRYYFDICEGNRVVTDEDGTELPGPEAAQAEARLVLAEICRHSLEDPAVPDLTMVVREASRPILRARLILEIELVN